MIRSAEIKDVPQIVDMLLAFQQEAGCYGHIDPCRDSLTNFITKMIGLPLRAPVVVYEVDGVIAGTTALIVEPSWFNYAQLAAQELFWYIRPEYRGRFGIAMRLFKWLEKWCVDNGVKSLSVASTGTLNVGKLEDFYTRRGFAKADVIYIKEVQRA